ncbi:MAG: DUF1573 domain-containing protein [Bacteroidales bacterium]|jgi:hypothetical protein|nr:DUF1573 domain-containing protein [Bacteroidales bacterium]
MKKLFFILTVCFLLISCKDKSGSGIGVDSITNPVSADGINQQKAEKMPVIQFESITHDFGKVIQGERLSYSFKFKNTGNSNLIISFVESTCGCTTSSPPKEPIKPGDSSEIKVTFDSKTKTGESINQVMVTANTYPINTVLTIKANVIKP